MAEDDQNDQLTPDEDDAVTEEEQPEAEAEAPEEAAAEEAPAEEPSAEEPEEAPAEEPAEAEAEAPAEAPAEAEADAEAPAEAEAEDAPEPQAEEAAEPPAEEAAEPPAEEAAEPQAEEAAPAAEEAAEPQAEEAAPAAEEAGAPAAEERRERRPDRPKEEKKPDVIPGEHLEPILPVEQPSAPDSEFDYAAYADDDEEGGETETVADEAAPTPTPLTPKELAADARYRATGKRKTSVARVILKPGSGAYVINGRTLEDFFPRATLQKAVRQPLETAGYEERMDVVARIHGGGVSAQAGALRHGVARALVEADPNLRGELKRRGFLTRDARAKERKKAGLKKARKRPQFSKR